MRAIWVKQLHRLLGTGIGILAAWGLLSLPFNNWSIFFTMMVLSLIVETTVVRHITVSRRFSSRRRRHA
ncbi:MAG: hypothetical protein LBU11_04825 [Zoogloeaceae bacterium]|nr:hypothetical protein [Zoogloeaceae bacterium]